jgi:glycine betaine/choline ABC-type transport system substrate-binding protein
MDKFHKYCLSVLLVIICSNISAQINNGTLGSDDYKKLCEVYSKFLNSQDCKESREFCVRKKTIQLNAIHQKQNAVDIAEIFSGNHHSDSHKEKFGSNGFENGKYDKILENFEKNSKEYGFAEMEYFKSKVSKIRNKDYLEATS